MLQKISEMSASIKTYLDFSEDQFQKEEFKTCLPQFELFRALKGQFGMDGSEIKASLSLSGEFVSHRHEERV